MCCFTFTVVSTLIVILVKFRSPCCFHRHLWSVVFDVRCLVVFDVHYYRRCPRSLSSNRHLSMLIVIVVFDVRCIVHRCVNSVHRRCPRNVIVGVDVHVSIHRLLRSFLFYNCFIIVVIVVFIRRQLP